ncbi:hypothetical protein [Actinocrispum sp. NPDC049592]|uniref:hypothetical protein n=1 Tax=Actinocrispum sp. NPDC049592 TaxID=3154835 RepID=UPI00342F3E45
MAAAFVVAATPASADGLAVEATVSPGQVQPGDAFTVTETVHNNTSGSILSPTIRLFSKEVPLPSYATMEGCSGLPDLTCTTVDTPSGPIGYMAVMSRAMNGFETVTIVFNLRVKADAQGAVHTLQGQLLGRNDGIDPVDVATLTVIAQADAAVSLSAVPKAGLLVPRIDVTVRVTNNGPGKLTSAEVRGALSPGLTANSGPGCTGGSQPVCTFGEIASGASATGTFSVPLGLLYIGLPFRISATKTASTPTDPVAANNSAATTCTVVTPLLVSCN